MASVQSTGRPMYYWNGTTWIPIASVIGDTEVIQDVAADLLDHLYHENITVNYDDANGRLILSAQGAVVSVNGQSGSVQLTTTSGALTDSASLATTAPSDVSIDWTVNQYFIVAIQLGNAGDSTTLRMANVILNKAV